jgi:hypothetical protein
MTFWDHAVQRSTNSVWSHSLGFLGNANCTFELRKICKLQLLGCRLSPGSIYRIVDFQEHKRIKREWYAPR